MRFGSTIFLFVMLITGWSGAQAPDASRFPFARGPLHCKGDLQITSTNEKKEKFKSVAGAITVDPTKFQKLEVRDGTKIIALIYPLYGLDSEKIETAAKIETDEENYVRVSVKEGSEKRSLECLF